LIRGTRAIRQLRKGAAVDKEMITKVIKIDIIKTTLIAIIILLLSSSLVLAHSDETFEQAEQLIASETPCEQLSSEQLEIIGDYYMEQVHLGEEHEIMDNMMGGEGSESLRQMHIQIARNYYCNERGGMTGIGMMDMMSNHATDKGGESKMMGYGMMYGYNPFSVVFGVIYFALACFVFSVIFWLTHEWIAKQKKGKRK